MKKTQSELTPKQEDALKKLRAEASLLTDDQREHYLQKGLEVFKVNTPLTVK